MNFSLARIMSKNVWLLCLPVFFTFAFPSAALAACAAPVGVAGDIVFNSASQVMQSCNGSTWQGWMKSNPGAWKDVVPGVDFSCGMKVDNSLWCWGMNYSGELGTGSAGADIPYPQSVTGGGVWIDFDIGQPPGGSGMACGIKTGGTLYCWGKDGHGEGGHSSLADTATPRAITSGGTWKDVTVGANWACAIKSDDTAWCWGENDQNKWGDGGAAGSWFYTTQAVAGGHTWKTLSAGSSGPNGFTCGIDMNDKGWCWGDNDYGQIGDGTSGTDRNAPTAISTTGVQTWKQIWAGNITACGIKTDGSGWCWGSNAGTGAIGNGVSNSSTTIYTTPQALSVTGVTTWADIRGRGDNACGIKTDGTGWCWGYGDEGNMGDGAVVSYSSPHEVIAGEKWKMLYSNWPTHGIKPNGTLWGWGENPHYAQGTGNNAQQNTPVIITGGSGTTCSSPTGAGGDILFNTAYRVLQWCDGRQWNPAGAISPSGPLAGCTGPTGVGGDLLFNSTAGSFQYCDGDNWQRIYQ